MKEKLAALERILKSYEKALVAYSGGIDSLLLVKVASGILGKRVIALTAVSPSYPSYELDSARDAAKEIGVEHIVIDSHELEKKEYRENKGDRCYFCKTELYHICLKEAEKRDIPFVLNGTNLDDLGDYRPGLKAAEENRVKSPLVEAGFTKEDIRQCAKDLGLAAWAKPALACLSSRFPPGTEVTPERLARIDRIESGLRELGFRQFRVRFHEPIARLEVHPDEMSRFLNHENRLFASKLCKENGFLYVALDLDGYQQGSVNRVLFQIQ